MNATRAATIRLRSSFDGAVSLGRVQTPTLAIIARREEEIRAFVPEPYWLVDAHVRAAAGEAGRGYSGRYHAGAQPAAEDRGGGRGGRRRGARRRGRDHQAREDHAQGARAAPVRPDVAAARRQHPLRLLRAAHAGRRPAPLRGAQGAHLSAHELALPVGATWRGRSSRPPSSWASNASTPRAARYVLGLDVLPLGRVINDAKVTDHHAIIPTRSQHRSTRCPTTTGASTTSSPVASSPSSIPTRCSRTRAWRRRSPSTCSAPAAACWWCRAGAASTARASRTPRRDDADEGADRQLPKLERGEAVDDARGRRRGEGDQAAAALLRRVAARARWRRPASSSTTTSCARR